MAFPTVVRRATAVSDTTNRNSFTPSWSWGTNTAIAAGERVVWFLIVSTDGDTSGQLDATSGTGGAAGSLVSPGAAWNYLGAVSQAAVTGGIWALETDAAFAASAWPNGNISWSGGTAEQASGAIVAFKMGSGKIGRLLSLTPPSAIGSSTNSNPVSSSNTSGLSQDVSILVSRSGDGTTVATAAPTNYGNLQTATGGGSNGASTNTAERQITLADGASEDPGTFTSANEQWVCWTAGVYESDMPVAMFPRHPLSASFQNLLRR